MNGVIGIGNALMDIMVRLEDDKLLEELNLPKGSMTLVNTETSDGINNKTEGLYKELTPGGSVANSIHGLASLGAKSAFIGKVGNDETGQLYGKELERIGAKPLLFKGNNPTGKAMGLVSPDSERTFGTYLGAAIELSADDLDISLFKNYEIAYIEGYLVQNHQLVETGCKLAKQVGCKIAIDLASFNVVEDNLDFLKRIIGQYVDIIFANEEEAKAFTGLEAEEAVWEMGRLVETTIVKIGKRGSYILQDNVISTIPGSAVIPIDTTGAGDLYAAGFLYGMVNNFDMIRCGRIAAILAGKVITVIGARIPDSEWPEIKEQVESLSR